MTARDYLPFATGALLLALDPIRWLAGTWTSPAYDSDGLLVALLALAIATWSLSSEKRGHSSFPSRNAAISKPTAPSRKRGMSPFFVATAGVRAAGQTLGVSVVSAIALVADVWALARLAGLHERRRAVSPGWLALLFAASFPFEFLVRRTGGFALQLLSAGAACQALRLGPDPVGCEGARLFLAGHEVLVDLPCSGARGLLVASVLFLALAAVRRPGPVAALAGIFITAGSTLVANALRIVVLAEGIAFPGRLGGLPVMEPPWHEAIGLAALALGLLPVVLWARSVTPARPPGERPVPDAAPLLPAGTSDTGPAGTRTHHGGSASSASGRSAARFPLLPDRRPPRGRAFGWAFAAVAVVIVTLPVNPVDVARTPAPVHLPFELAGAVSVPDTLRPRERLYFVRYGGSAARARYGEHELLAVRTAAPLRHLHGPGECLAGAGHSVRYVGVRELAIPMAEYRAVDPAGRAWRVAAAYVSDRGELATSVGEAVWSWLGRPSGTWTMLQTIAPWDHPPEDLLAFRTALAAAFDLPKRGQSPFSKRKWGLSPFSDRNERSDS